MKTFRCENLCVLLRVHRRHRFLPAIFEQIKHLARGRKATVYVLADRPSPDVVGTLEAIKAKLPKRIRTEVFEAPFPVLSSEGARWTEAVQYLYGQVPEGVHDVGVLWDDDLLFSDTALGELRGALEFFEWDRVEAVWLHIGDEAFRSYDRAFPVHRATAAFRVVPSDNWDLKLVSYVIGGGTHSPAQVAASPAFATMRGRVLHFGYAETSERERRWGEAKMTGQIDAHYKVLARKPELRLLRGPDQTTRFLEYVYHE